MLNKLRTRKSEGGFTLVELLIVIVILGILAAIVVFAVGGITDKGQSASCSQDAKSLQSAEEAYFAQSTGYASEANLVPKYLHQQSSLYDITVSGGTYTLTPVGTTCPANP